MKTLTAVLFALFLLLPCEAFAQCANGVCSFSRPTLFGGRVTRTWTPGPAVSAYRAARYNAVYDSTPVPVAPYAAQETFLHWGPPTYQDYQSIGVTPPQPTPATPPSPNAPPNTGAGCENCDCQDRLVEMEADLMALKVQVGELEEKLKPGPFGAAPKKVSQDRSIPTAIAYAKPRLFIPEELATRRTIPTTLLAVK